MRYFILFCVALLTYMGTEAQIHNTGVLYVGNGNTLYSGGDFTNTAGAYYKNDGSVYINGNAGNDQPALAAGAGTTYFNGLTAQALTGTAPFRCFNVVLNNPAGLTLSNRLAIGDVTGGTLNFTAGQHPFGPETPDVTFFASFGSTRVLSRHPMHAHINK